MRQCLSPDPFPLSAFDRGPCVWQQQDGALEAALQGILGEGERADPQLLRAEPRASQGAGLDLRRTRRLPCPAQASVGRHGRVHSGADWTPQREELAPRSARLWGGLHGLTGSSRQPSSCRCSAPSALTPGPRTGASWEKLFFFVALSGVGGSLLPAPALAHGGLHTPCGAGGEGLAVLRGPGGHVKDAVMLAAPLDVGGGDIRVSQSFSSYVSLGR